MPGPGLQNIDRCNNDDITDITSARMGRQSGFHLAQSAYWKRFKEVCTDGFVLSFGLTDWLTCDCRILSVTEPLCFTVLQFTLHTGYRIRKSARCRNNWVRSTHMLYRIVIEIVHVQCSVQFSVKFGSMLRPRTFQGYVITCVQSLAEEYVGGMFGNWSDYSLINLLQITN